MRIDELELTGYAGLGRFQNHIKIKFGYNKITMIKGLNGSGKSTILTAASIYPDGNNMFLRSVPAEKKVTLTNNGVRYKIIISHPVNGNGDRTTTKAYISKEEQGNWVEYNPVGTVGSYKDYIETEFDLDPNFVSLSFLSTESKGIVERTPAERKKMVNSITEYVEVYNNMHKVLNKRSSVYKSLINTLVEKINIIGNEESLTIELNSVLEVISALTIERSKLVDIISTNKAAINLADPDGSIQTLYRELQIEIERIKDSLKTQSKNETFIFSKMDFEIPCSVLSETTESYSITKAAVDNYNNMKDILQKSLDDFLTEQEQENKAIQVMTERINGLQSEYNYDMLIDMIKTNENNKKAYEEIFKEINISNAKSISKDEYITGLNTLNDIKDMIRAIEGSNYIGTIQEAIKGMLDGINFATVINNYEMQIDECKLDLETLNDEIIRTQVLVERASILKDRPERCKINSCPFIAEALQAEANKPADALVRMEKKYADIEEELKNNTQARDHAKDCVEVVNQLNIILRNIQNNSAIISKLPIGSRFLDKNALLDAIYNGDTFDEVEELYKYINHANIFEEYRTTLDTLKDLKSEYKIYQAKASTLDDLNKDLEELNYKLSGVVEKIEKTNTEIAELDTLIINSNNRITILDDLLVIQRRIEDLKLQLEDATKREKTILGNMETIKGNIIAIEQAEIKMKEIDERIKPLEDNKSALQYSMAMLRDYTNEVAEYEKSYNLLEILKEYTSPTKHGIQQIFIKIYMSQTLTLANNLLSLFFGGRLKLLPYEIEDDKFSIPYYSETTMMPTDDVSSASRSEKAMINLALAGALLKQGSSTYNILRLDEIDEGLDTGNRMGFMRAIDEISSALGIEQILMVSHTTEIQVDSNIDVIMLSSGVEIGEMGGNVIWEN